MREYILTSPLIEGTIRFGYADTGRMVKFELNAELDTSQYQFLYNPAHFPFTLEKLAIFAGNKGTITEVTDITFDRFWKEFNYKVGKVKAQCEWKKLTDDDKAKALARIKAYHFACKAHSREMVYPERYLKHRRFDDE